MPPRRRLNDHKFCVCSHGQGAHRNGISVCVGEKRFKGEWVPCACDHFVHQPEEAQPEEAEPDSSTRGSTNGVNTESIGE